MIDIIYKRVIFHVKVNPFFVYLVILVSPKITLVFLPFDLK